MFALASDHTIHYRLTIKPGGVKLSLWEPAVRTERRPQPYLFVVHYYLGSVDEAREVMRHYLMGNGVHSVQNVELKNEGKIRILPCPTWPAPVESFPEN